MMRYFEFKDEKSNKFWEISLNDGATSFTVRYGKTGSNGSIITKDWESIEKAKQEAEKLIAEKLKKGYTEMTSGKTEFVDVDYKSEWQKIVNSSDLKASLVNHFKILATGDESKNLLEEMMNKATKVEIITDSLVIQFGAEYKMICSEPSMVKPSKEVPKSYAELVKLHSRIDIEGPDVPLTFIGLNESGELYGSEFIDEAEDFLDTLDAKELTPDDVFLALYNHQDELIFNPLKKSKAKEPAVCHLYHDDCEVSKPISLEWNFAEIFLGVMASDILDRDCFEETPDKKNAKNKNDKKLSVEKLASAEAMYRADWKEQVLFFLDTDRSYLEEWEGLRKSMDSLCKKVLSLPAAINHKDWSEIVRLITDQTVRFSEYSEEIYGESVDPEDDEGGLIESYSDEEMYTTDLVLNLLAIPETQKVSDWKDLVIYAFEVKDEAMGYMSNGSEAAKAFMKKAHVKSHPNYAEILKAAKDAYPFDVS